MRKKISIKIVTLLMAMVMLLTAGATTAFAAGNDYFPKGQWHSIGEFAFKNNNTTPWKTVDSSASNMYLDLDFKKADGNNPTGLVDAGQGRLRLLIYVEREGESGRELIFSCPTNYDNSVCNEQTLSFHVNPGQRIRFFFDAVSEDGSNGNYRSCHIVQWKGFAY